MVLEVSKGGCSLIDLAHLLGRIIRSFLGGRALALLKPHHLRPPPRESRNEMEMEMGMDPSSIPTLGDIYCS